ncbi:hypothetical protein TIFTF001_028805 [Ficus carica]|uniref:Uncharacterized protein n=1 Tax=Ficus carica TaxID=3494 RepID=A0AA88DQL0_FICCA|nr:hypothetical protein TIFTF001_028805 [Ficus carica]
MDWRLTEERRRCEGLGKGNDVKGKSEILTPTSNHRSHCTTTAKALESSHHFLLHASHNAQDRLESNFLPRPFTTLSSFYLVEEDKA